MMFSISRPLMLRIARPSELTTPVETVDCRPSGLPTAITSWPTLRAFESPISMYGSPEARTFRAARSVGGSSPTISAERTEPSVKCTRTSLALWTTWLLVRM